MVFEYSSGMGQSSGAHGKLQTKNTRVAAKNIVIGQDNAPTPTAEGKKFETYIHIAGLVGNNGVAGLLLRY